MHVEHPIEFIAVGPLVSQENENGGMGSPLLDLKDLGNDYNQSNTITEFYFSLTSTGQLKKDICKASGKFEYELIIWH